MAPRQRIFSSQGPSDDDPSLLSQDSKAPRKTLTLNQTESDIARDWHDYFNLVALLFLIGSTALNYEIKWEDSKLSWTGSYFWLNWATTIVYFIIDLLWVAMIPICVKSPGVIIKHHLVAMVYLWGPVCYPEYRWFMGALLSVEVNTWFLIMRRVVFKSGSANPLVGLVVSTLFYLTWILIRCIIYPGVLLTFFKLAVERIQETGVFFHLPMLFIPAHAVLCVLNLKWTYDLFKPIIERWLGIGPRAMVVQNGL